MNPTLGYALLGLLAGFASGCFGIGGGIIIVPVLVLLFKIDYHIAVGTSLALIIPISLAGSATNFSLGKINWPIIKKGLKEIIDVPDEEELAEIAFGVYRAVEAGVDYPNRGWQCGTCAFGAACRR